MGRNNNDFHTSRASEIDYSATSARKAWNLHLEAKNRRNKLGPITASATGEITMPKKLGTSNGN
jgi:hypothetical protein